MTTTMVRASDGERELHVSQVTTLIKGEPPEVARQQAASRSKGAGQIVVAAEAGLQRKLTCVRPGLAYALHEPAKPHANEILAAGHAEALAEVQQQRAPARADFHRQLRTCG